MTVRACPPTDLYYSVPRLARSVPDANGRDLRRRGRRRRSAGALARIVAAAVTAMACTAARSEAQAWVYPSFQQSHMVNREFTFAVADGGYDGTSYIFQWREEMAPRNQFSFDGGLASGVGGHTVAFVGALYGYQFVQPRDSQPIEILGNTGLTLAFGHGGTYTRVPVAVSAGHRFALGNGVALTPYVHPRVSLEFCSHCVAQVRGGSATAGVGAGFGVGANLELSSRFSVRFDSSISGSTIASQDNAFGFGVAWAPSGLRRQ